MTRVEQELQSVTATAAYWQADAAAGQFTTQRYMHHTHNSMR
jgi:hypothetical protein